MAALRPQGRLKGGALISGAEPSEPANTAGGSGAINESKEIWATDFKILLQRKDVVLPKDRQLVAQIHSIKRRLTPTGKPSFEVEREEVGRGHADRYWSCALACQKERGPLPGFLPEIGIRVIG